MGGEVRCACRWGDRAGTVTALLESSEIVVRRDLRARAPLDAIEGLRVDGDDLAFSVANDRVVLTLGATSARSWAAKIATPPPSLAHKLGITPATRLHVRGTDDDAAPARSVRTSCAS